MVELTNGRKDGFMKKAGIMIILLLTAGLLGCGNAADMETAGDRN